MTSTTPTTNQTNTTANAGNIGNAAQITGFDFQMRTRYVVGPGCAERIGEVAKELGARCALIVTDPGIVSAGHCDRVLTALQAAGVEAVVYDAVRENPTTTDVARCVETARSCDIDIIIGLGGGSSMDTAKGCALLLANEGDVKDFWHSERCSAQTLPLIALPTTAGTGSESQSYALVADDKTHQKMAIGDPMLSVRVALLDPILTLTQPQTVTVCSGLDAVSHALETAVTNCGTPISRLFSRQAFALTSSALARVLDDPDELQARADMQWGASLGGLAIECSMLGAAHAAANPLTAHFGVVHGHAVGLMLPHVIRHNAQNPDVAQAYRSLALARNLDNPEADSVCDAHRIAAWIDTMLERAGLARTLSDLDVGPAFDSALIPTLAADAAEQWTGRFNPVPMDVKAFIDLYQNALA